MRIIVKNFTPRELKIINESTDYWRLHGAVVKVNDDVETFDVSEITVSAGRNSQEKGIVNLLNCDGRKFMQIVIKPHQTLIFDTNEAGEVYINVTDSLKDFMNFLIGVSK